MIDVAGAVTDTDESYGAHVATENKTLTIRVIAIATAIAIETCIRLEE